MKYFLIWTNYDGSYTENFKTKEELEERATQILSIANKENDSYGTFVYFAFKIEEEYDFKPMEVTTKYKAVKV